MGATIANATSTCSWCWPHSHVCQRRLCLGQPERHVHGTIQIESGGQRGTRLLIPSHLTI